MNLAETLVKIEEEKFDNLRKLVLLPFEKLKKQEYEYWQLYKDASENGQDEAAKVHYLKCSIFSEAIRIKQGNEEQAWDYLT